MNMKSKLFRRPTALSPEGHLSILSRGAASGRAAALSALLLLFAAPVFAQYNLSLCEGQSFMLTSDADGHPDLGQLTYTWKEGVPPQVPGTVTAVPSLTVTGKPAGTYAYVCEVANAVCTLSTSSYTVEVVAVPAAPVITAPAEICQNGALTFWVDSPLTSNATYTWTASDGTLSGSSWTFDTSTDGAKTATVSVKVPAGDITCQSDNAQTATATVVASPPIPTLSRSAETVCSGTAITFTASGGSVYEWSCSGSGFTCSGTGATQPTPTTVGNYTASVRAVNASGGLTCYSEYTPSQPASIKGPGTNNQAATCGCATNTTNCSGTCKTNGNTIQNNGGCTGACYTAYKQEYNVCGVLVSTNAGTYTNNSCSSGSTYTRDGSCAGCLTAYIQERNKCNNVVINNQYGTYESYACYSSCGQASYCGGQGTTGMASYTLIYVGNAYVDYAPYICKGLGYSAYGRYCSSTYDDCRVIACGSCR
jgi:hypothetical protein